MNYLNSLTSLRGLAAWWVVVYHFRDATGLPSGVLVYRLLEKGYLAVDFFFVLSGFIIFLNYRESLRSLSSSSVFEFFIKRLARVYPLHLVVMIAFLLNPIAILFASQQADLGTRYGWDYYLASLFMVQNWGLFDDLAWNIPAWSISTEFAAYLLFPLMLAGIVRLCRMPLAHLLLWVAAGLTISTVYASQGYASIGDGIPRIGLVRCILEFGMGVVTGSYYVSARQGTSRLQLPLLSLLILLLGAAILGPFPDYVFWPFAFSVMVLYVAVDAPLARKLLGSKRLLFLGEISYSTYLVHYFVKDWVKFLSHETRLIQFCIYVTAVFIASVVLYRFVERPGRTWIRQRYVKA